MNNALQTPFFSVIICSYNRADIIGRALHSLIRQKNTDWEGIIIDDGSEDHTAEVVQPFLEKYPIRYLKKEHGGLASSRNAGLKAARGKYITFLDTDDEYAAEHLQIRHKILKEQPGIDLLHSNVTIIGNPYLPDKNNPQQQIHINECVVGGTFSIKKESLSSTHVFQDRYSDDSFFLESMAAKEKNIRKIDSPTYIYYRDMEDSLTNQANQ